MRRATRAQFSSFHASRVASFARIGKLTTSVFINVGGDDDLMRRNPDVSCIFVGCIFISPPMNIATLYVAQASFLSITEKRERERETFKHAFKPREQNRNLENSRFLESTMLRQISRDRHRNHNRTWRGGWNRPNFIAKLFLCQP